ncbi:MAG: phosphate/phosphite/phosphonate ABC transporter substrate-binding protein [Bdellovibrionota bacterium]
MFKFQVIFSLIFTLILSVSCTSKRDKELGSAENPVKFFFVPSVDATLLDSGAKVVKEYLEKETPYKYKFAIPQSYVAVVEAFGTDRADVASLNTFGYILANEKYGVEALIRVIRYGSDTYKSQIIAKADGPIKKLEDINGKKFAYVDSASTSGYLLPAKYLKDKGVQPESVVFAKKHDNVVTMIYQGQVDAGATFYTPPDNGKIQDARRLVKTQFPDVEEKIKIVELTSDIPNDPIVFRKDLSPEMKKTIQDALLKFVKTPDGAKAFHDLYGVTDFKVSTDKDYDSVRDILKALGKNASDLIK